MSNLSAFFAENAAGVDVEKVVVSRRFTGEDGEPMEWEIGCIPSSEDEALRKEATRRIPVPGKRNQYTSDMDVNLYLGRMAAKCTLFPNLNDTELQNSYGVMGADVLLKRMLLPGEYADYLEKVQEVNGFNVSFGEQVDEIKN